MKRQNVLWAVSILCAGLVGCISPQQMAPVVSAGMQAADQGAAATAELRAGLATLREEGYVAAAMGTGIPGIEERAEDAVEISDLLFKRQAMLTQLSKMYRSLKDLVDYDAAGEIEGSVGGAVAAALEYVEASGRSSVPAAESIAKLSDFAAQKLVTSIQNRQLAKVNAGLAELIEPIVEQLECEQSAWEAIGGQLHVSNQNVLLGMLQKRVAWPHTLLAEHAAAVGLVYEPKEFVRVYEEMRKDEGQREAFQRMQSMLIRAHLARLDRQAALNKRVLGKTIAALTAVAKSHRQLDEGSRRIDLTELSAVVSELQVVATEAAIIAREVRAAKAAARAESRKERDELLKTFEQKLLEHIAKKLGVELPQQ